jgi:hypothetical protein
VDVEQPVGKALNRDISRSEQVETDLDNLIDRRDRMRRLEEGERAEELAWRESVRVFQEKRRQQARVEWSAYHSEQAERLRANLVALISHHEQRAEELASLEAPLGGGDAA